MHNYLQQAYMYGMGEALKEHGYASFEEVEKVAAALGLTPDEDLNYMEKQAIKYSGPYTPEMHDYMRRKYRPRPGEKRPSLSEDIKFGLKDIISAFKERQSKSKPKAK